MIILTENSGLQVDRVDPCNTFVGKSERKLDFINFQNVKDPSMMSYMKVQRALELNAPFLQCEKFFHILSIQELRGE